MFTKKASFSIFRTGEFVDFLDREKITDLYFSGMDTDACVFVSIMEAFERGYKVRLIEDLCMTHHGDEYQRNTINILERNLSKKVIINSQEI